MTADEAHASFWSANKTPAPTFWLEFFGAEVRFREAGGHRTRSIESGGEGQPVVLLHGLSGHAETWVRTVTPLARLGFRVHAIDMLGHGLTAKPKVDYSVQLLAEHVLGFLDAIGARTAHFVGQSLGGWVASWLAIYRPDRVASLTSVTGAGLELTEDGAELTERLGRRVGDVTRKALDRPTKDSVRARLEWLMHNPAVVTDELVESRFRVYTQPDFIAVADRLVNALTSTSSRQEVLTAERLARIACPTMILWTRQNPTMPWEVGKQASQIIPGARWYLMEDAGHWPQYEKPTEFLQVLGRFLGSADEDSGGAGKEND